MATATRTRTRATQPVDDETPVQTPIGDPVDDDEDEEDEEEEDEPVPSRGKAASASTATSRGPTRSVAPARASVDAEDDDDLDDDDDDDDSIIIGDAWDEATEPSGEFPMVDRGPYVVLLDAAETRRAGEKAKNPGQKYGVAVFKIRSEDNPDTMEEDAQTVTIWHSLFFTPASLGRTKKFLRGADITVRAGDDIIAILQDLADEEALFNASIGIEKYRGEDEETGKLVNKSRNKILRLNGRAD